MTRIAAIAAIYAVLTIILAPISYGAIQVRVAEALTVLPFLTVDAVPGLFVGCLAANVYGGLGLSDIVFGSLATLLAAVVTWRVPRPWLAPLPPVVANALIVPAYLAALLHVPYWILAGSIAAGEFLACYVLGYPLLLYIRRRPSLARLLE